MCHDGYTYDNQESAHQLWWPQGPKEPLGKDYSLQVFTLHHRRECDEKLQEQHLIMITSIKGLTLLILSFYLRICEVKVGTLFMDIVRIKKSCQVEKHRISGTSPFTVNICDKKSFFIQ